MAATSENSLTSLQPSSQPQTLQVQLKGRVRKRNGLGGNQVSCLSSVSPRESRRLVRCCLFISPDLTAEPAGLPHSRVSAGDLGLTPWLPLFCWGGHLSIGGFLWKTIRSLEHHSLDRGAQALPGGNVGCWKCLLPASDSNKMLRAALPCNWDEVHTQPN